MIITLLQLVQSKRKVQSRPELFVYLFFIENPCCPEKNVIFIPILPKLVLRMLNFSVVNTVCYRKTGTS